MQQEDGDGTKAGGKEVQGEVGAAPGGLTYTYWIDDAGDVLRLPHGVDPTASTPYCSVCARQVLLVREANRDDVDRLRHENRLVTSADLEAWLNRHAV